MMCDNLHKTHEMSMQWIKQHYTLITILVFLVVLNGFFYFHNPQDIVERIGIRNTYVLSFCIAAIGGLSTVTGTVLYSALVTFAAGGSAPWLLGISGGLGIFVSDSIFFFLARLSVQHIPKDKKKWVYKIQKLVSKYPVWKMLIVVYAYLGFLPLPNDILMIALAMTNITYSKLCPIILLGSISFALVTSQFGSALSTL